jgi:hypothetical protein
VSESIPDIVLRLAHAEIARGTATSGDLLATLPFDSTQPRSRHPVRSPDASQPAPDEQPEQSDNLLTPDEESGGRRSRGAADALPSGNDRSVGNESADVGPLPIGTEIRRWAHIGGSAGASPSLAGDSPFQLADDASRPDLDHAAAAMAVTPQSIIDPPSSAARSTSFSRSQVGEPLILQPPEGGTTNGAANGTDRLPDSISDHAGRLEQLSRELDSSLTRLFSTQLETLDHLRQRLDEHERLWLEQQALRRAAYV